MFERQRTGSVVCPSCQRLVGVSEAKCFYCGYPNPGMWGFSKLLRGVAADLGFPQLVVWACVALYALTLLSDLSGIRAGGMFSFLSPSLSALRLFGASGAVPVFLEGKWWTVLSAAWLHGGLLHILFNMMWVRQLAPATSDEYGSGRTVIIYTVSSISGFLLSSGMGLLVFLPSVLRGASFTLGASAPIFGLLGALVWVGKRGSSQVGRQAWTFAVILFAFGFVMAGIDNWAHLGGFLGGYLAARWLDPLAPERPVHQLAALGCIALTVLSVAVSVLSGWSRFQGGSAF